ncbi:hypothetical protein ACM7Q1_05290 [Paenibacillus illinoisensis]|uniref:hypothetical protein n=1 Tax=Paenibacillus illinoisensis TaxID=59845 RepID=UPI003A4E5FF1
MNKRQFIEMTVKEQCSIVFKVNNQDEFFRGVSKELNEGCLFVEAEEGINFKFEMDDIIEIYAVKSSSPGHIAIQSPSLMRGSKDDLENLVLLFEGLNDDVKKPGYEIVESTQINSNEVQLYVVQKYAGQGYKQSPPLPYKVFKSENGWKVLVEPLEINTVTGEVTKGTPIQEWKYTDN